MLSSESAVTPQYSLKKIMLIWLLSAAPMGAMLWLVMPLFIQHTMLNPVLTYFCLATLGLVWQGVLAYIILKQELGILTWDKLKVRLWLDKPTSPQSGVKSNLYYLYAIPFIAFALLWDGFGILSEANTLLLAYFPSLTPPEYGLIENLEKPAAGQYWLFAVLFILILFNYLLGEELIFRGILLPKMNAVFGRYDWLANGVLFALYHLHLIWQIPSNLLLRDWIYSYAAKRYKSYFISVLIHGFDSVILTYLAYQAITH